MEDQNRTANETVVNGQQLQVMPIMSGDITVPSNNGNPWSFYQKLLSSHLLAVGSIGSGKTNLLYHIVEQVIKKITAKDIIIFFDSKGDFLKRFHRPGDYVVGNSHQYSGYTLSNWNLYEELNQTGTLNREDTIREVATSLFKKRLIPQKTLPLRAEHEIFLFQ